MSHIRVGVCRGWRATTPFLYRQRPNTADINMAPCPGEEEDNVEFHQVGFRLLGSIGR